MGKEPLAVRIYADALYTAICRIVHYGGFPFQELAAHMKPLIEQHGARRVSEALSQLVTHEGWRIMLNPLAREACQRLLGPAVPREAACVNPQHKPLHRQIPEVITPSDAVLDSLARLSHTELNEKLQDARRRKAIDEVQAIASEMVRRGMDLPPAAALEARHLSRPRVPAHETPPETEFLDGGSVSAAMAGLSADGYAAEAKKRNRRQLLCMLRDARKKLAHHGHRSFMGKEAKKEIAAVEAELRGHRIEIPPEGEETAQWDRKKE